MSGQKKKAIGWERKKAKIDTRKVILQYSAQMFSESGFNATGMRRIAQAVGINPASLYNHFSSKNEILYTLLKEAMDNLLFSCRSAVEHSPQRPTDRLKIFVKDYIH